VQRLEYRLTVSRGEVSGTVCDPANPVTVPTAFGERSVLRLPGYAEPTWLSAESPEGEYRPLHVVGETEDALPVTLWTPAALDPATPARLLLVHDGPEYDLYAGITKYAAVMQSSGALPAFRVALAQPVQRDAWYSGSPKYLRTVVEHGLDDIAAAYAVEGPVVVMGASLGGLTALLAGLLGAPRTGGVFSQSGSFFQHRHDDAESAFKYFERVSRTVRTVLDARDAPHPMHVAMTCGALEENLANNEDMARALRRAGHHVDFRTVPDLHNYTAWRDSLDPALTDLLRECWITT
jgi:enterochelin esterase family protein